MSAPALAPTFTETFQATAARHPHRLAVSDPDGSIRAAFAFLRLGGALSQSHPAQLAESVAVNALLTWAHPVTPSQPLAALIRAAYDPLLPACARDPSHALRLAARLQAPSSL